MMERKKVNDWFGFFAPRFCALTLIAGIVIRIILLLMPITEASFSFGQYLRIFGLGAVNDLAFSAIGLVLAFLFYSFMTDAKYGKPWGWIIEGILAAVTFYVVCFNDITDEYGSAVPHIANALLLLLLACFSLKLFVPKVRQAWRKWFILVIMGAYAMFVVLLNIVGEPVFWEEFGVRYNFIAVDYLVYTNEVIGNIVESYPMVPIVLGVLAASALICWVMTLKRDVSHAGIASWKHWLISLVALAVSAVAGAGWLHWGYRNLSSQNVFLTQLQENGCWDFLEAYSSSELDYRQFYPMIPEDEAVSLQRELCGQNAEGVQLVAPADSASLENRKNIVLITIESMSADFMAAYGNTSGITPNLDSLRNRGLAFDNLFATGNRTVRGLEAVTLCIPPSSGESIVKRPGNENLYCTAEVLRSKGYSTSFIYGGDSYFDNMKAFFGGNGYEIHDKNCYDKDAIIFDNIWGTCDEDTYREALNLFDAKSESGQPFFAHIMTVSNHRPYTYPEGRISYDGNPMSRKAAVKYTDWAIGDFISKAAGHKWFGNTVFVILADHCASSAGKTSLPLECYHIPAIIYAPGFIQPRTVGKICSQIDLMPTLFSLLGFTYDSRFYGQDVLGDGFRERAFMATYQDLGYYADSTLTVLSPVKQIKQFDVKTDGNWQYVETLLESPRDSVLREAQALYQCVNLKNAGGNL